MNSTMDKQMENFVLDCLLAEKVMGWRRTGTSDAPAWEVPGLPLRTREETSYKGFSPSTDIRAAWEVVNRLIIEGYEDFDLDFDGDIWECSITNYLDVTGRAEGKTAPLAICLCALKLKGIRIAG